MSTLKLSLFEEPLWILDAAWTNVDRRIEQMEKGILVEGDSSEANVALSEIENGLKSADMRVCCETIHKISRYFEKHEFPTFVNAVFFKLAEVFRCGSNLLRKCIVEVVSTNEKQCHKIISGTELAKRIFLVSYSNDAVARALTLRLLGSLSMVLYDNKTALYLILNSLDSRDVEELDAAIYAIKRFSKQCNTFSGEIFDKVTEKMKCSNFLLENKVKLLPVFRYMYAGMETGQEIFDFYTNYLLPTAENSMVFQMLLRTMTEFVVNCFIFIPNQMKILLSIIDSRRTERVKKNVLCCLNVIATKSPQFWSAAELDVFCDISLKLQSPDLLVDAATIICRLSNGQWVNIWSIKRDCKLMALCTHFLSFAHPWLFLSVLKVYTNLALYLDDADTVEALNADLLCCMPLGLSYISDGVLFADKEKMAFTKAFAVCLLRYGQPDRSKSMFCAQVLLSIIERHEDLQDVVLPCLLTLRDEHPPVLSLTCDVLNLGRFSLHRFSPALCSLLLPPMKHDVDPELSTIACHVQNCWQLYQVGRHGLHYGYFSTAEKVFCILQNKVSSDRFNWWISTLLQISTAEHLLCSQWTNILTFYSNIQKVLTLYRQCILELKAAVNPPANRWFVVKFCKLRAEFLSTMAGLINTINHIRLCPPPKASSDSMIIAHFANLFSKSCADFRQLSNAYEQLASRCFDSDRRTLNLLALLQKQCFLLSQVFEVSFSKESGHCMDEPQLPSISTCNRILAESLSNVVKRFNSLEYPSEPSPRRLLENIITMVTEVAKIPFFFPCFFFRKAQHTTVKLLISPTASDSERQITLCSNHKLITKVEGIVTTRKLRSNLPRRVSKVVVTLLSESEKTDLMKLSGGVGRNLSKTVEVQNDYFVSEFALEFTKSGVMNIRIGFIDDVDGKTWNTETEETIRVKVLGDRKRKISANGVAKLSSKDHPLPVQS